MEFLMCGIVAHLGTENSIEIVLEGLKRLEYRGYDSSGISFLSHEKKDLELFKREGKLENLKEVLSGEDRESEVCIGHTRWATHGKVNDINAHPHRFDNISIVHNGIVENDGDLRNYLRESGFEVKSETDTETFLGLLIVNQKSSSSFLEAVSKSFKQIEGNSAFVILNKDTEELVAVKRGAPLVCGETNDHQNLYASSDPYALVGYAEQLYFPEDEVICCFSKGKKISFLELDQTPSTRFLAKEQVRTLDISEKGPFEHYMLKEIHEQPSRIRSFVDYYFNGEGVEFLNSLKNERPKRVLISACGTAFYAGLVIRDYIEAINKIPCSNEIASEFRYRNPIIEKGDWGVFISQSGETADTLAAQEYCGNQGVKTLSIVNVDGSTLFRDCTKNLLIKAGIEIGVASTKAFTLQSLTGRMYAACLESASTESTLQSKILLLADRIDELLTQSANIKEVAESIYNYKGFFFTGRGMYFPMALEGALKLKEIAYVHAEGYASGELKHGPIALIDEEMVNIAMVGPELFEKTISNIQEIKARHGKIVVIGPENNKTCEEISDYYIGLNFSGLEELAPLYVNVANQLLAYYMAKFKGTDIDRPRNLAKSVTVE
jgi:glutamine---fructose-6-phosphate transaminase (isomerizing)